MSDKRGPSGLTEREAAEYHGQFVLWTMIWAAGAAAAHFSAWMWRPWIHSLSQIEIGRAHVRTPVTEKSRMPSSA